MTLAVGEAQSQRLDLEAINPMLEGLTPPKIVEWAVAQFGNDLIMSSSFGADSATLIHMATRVFPRIKIVMVDTGYLFPETHKFMEDLRHRFDLNVWVYHSPNDPIAYLRAAGEENPAFRKDVKACCDANKNPIFARAVRELKPAAWMRGVRANQTSDREKMQIVEWSERDECYAISPILRWTTRDIFNYMKQHDLPHHPLYDKGYTSIGCNPLSCTRPVQPGEDPRSGRWAGSDKVECGINLTNSLDSANL